MHLYLVGKKRIGLDCNGLDCSVWKGTNSYWGSSRPFQAALALLDTQAHVAAVQAGLTLPLWSAFIAPRCSLSKSSAPARCSEPRTPGAAIKSSASVSRKCWSGATGMWRCVLHETCPPPSKGETTLAPFGPNLETLNVIISEPLLHFSNTWPCSGRTTLTVECFFPRYRVNVPRLELTSCFSHIAIELFALWLHISYMTWLKFLFLFLSIDFFLLLFFTQVVKEINRGCY